MIKKIYNGLIFLTIFSLPWQAKLIIRAAEINYWEISLFLPMIFLFIFITVFYKKIFLNFKNKYLNKIIISLAVFELFVFISLFFSCDISLSIYRYFILLLALFLFLIVRHFKKEQKEIIIWAFLIASFFQAIIAIYQFIWQKSFAFKYLGIAFQDASVLGTSVIETDSGRFLRAYGALDHPNILGGLMALACLYSFCFLVKKKNYSINRKLYLWLIYLFSLSALFFSFSRSAWLAFIIIKLILVISLFIKKLAVKRVLFICLSSLFLITSFSLIYHDLVSTRLLAKGRIEQISLNERSQAIKEYKLASNHQLFLGKGLGTYSLYEYINDDRKHEAWYYQPIHNVYLLALSEIGLLGFLAFLVFIFFYILEIIRKKKKYLILSLVTILFFLIIFFFDHWFLTIPFGLWLFFLFLAIIE
jgi:O-antigen ligase